MYKIGLYKERGARTFLAEEKDFPRQDGFPLGGIVGKIWEGLGCRTVVSYHTDYTSSSFRGWRAPMRQIHWYPSENSPLTSGDYIFGEIETAIRLGIELWFGMWPKAPIWACGFLFNKAYICSLIR